MHKPPPSWGKRSVYGDTRAGVGYGVGPEGKSRPGPIRCNLSEICRSTVSGEASWGTKLKYVDDLATRVRLGIPGRRQGRSLPRELHEGVVDWMTPESGDVTGRLMVTKDLPYTFPQD